MDTLLNTSLNHGNLPKPVYFTVQLGSSRLSVGKISSDPPPEVYAERKAGMSTSALYLFTAPNCGLYAVPPSCTPFASVMPCGYVALA